MAGAGSDLSIQILGVRVPASPFKMDYPHIAPLTQCILYVILRLIDKSGPCICRIFQKPAITGGFLFTATSNILATLHSVIFEYSHAPTTLDTTAMFPLSRILVTASSCAVWSYPAVPDDPKNAPNQGNPLRKRRYSSLLCWDAIEDVGVLVKTVQYLVFVPQAMLYFHGELRNHRRNEYNALPLADVLQIDQTHSCTHWQRVAR